LAVGLLCPAVVLAAMAAAAAEAGSAQRAELRYEVLIPRPQIEAGKSLYVEARLHNDGDQPVAVAWAIMPTTTSTILRSEMQTADPWPGRPAV
jgi:hypothetical protein